MLLKIGQNHLQLLNDQKSQIGKIMREKVLEKIIQKKTLGLLFYSFDSMFTFFLIF